MSVGRVPDILFFGFKIYVCRYVTKTNDIIPPTTSSQVGLQFALLSEEGGSEADGWCLGFRTIACGREIPSNHRTNCNRCDSCCRLRAGTPSVSFADSSLHLREPRICANLKVIKKSE